jgi:hypothetical protein
LGAPSRDFKISATSKSWYSWAVALLDYSIPGNSNSDGHRNAHSTAVHRFFSYDQLPCRPCPEFISPVGYSMQSFNSEFIMGRSCIIIIAMITMARLGWYVHFVVLNFKMNFPLPHAIYWNCSVSSIHKFISFNWVSSKFYSP